MTWFQMTYASAAATPERRGGWGVLQKDEGVPAALLELMEQGVVTQVNPDEELPEFSTEATLAKRPRSLRYFFDPVRGVVWWHACQAGHDVTGRPGNVFNHVVASVLPTPNLRPISLLRSGRWLTPFGHREVSEARLAPFSLSSGAQEMRDALRRAMDEPNLTEALLAAVAHCIHADRPLVLVGDESDVLDALERASWTTAATVCATISFTTRDRAHSTPPLSAAFSITGVPPEDRDEVLRRVVAGESEALVLELRQKAEESEDTWSVGDQSWPVDRLWQDSFYRLAGLELDQAVHIAATMDDICRPLTAGELLSPGWPLALALLRHLGEAHPDLDTLRRAWNRSRYRDVLADRELRTLLQVDQPVEVSADSFAVTTDVSLPETDEASSLSPRMREAIDQLCAVARNESGDSIAQSVRQAVNDVLTRPTEEPGYWSRKVQEEA